MLILKLSEFIFEVMSEVIKNNFTKEAKRKINHNVELNHVKIP